MKDMGNVSFVLDIMILKYHSHGILKLSQESYISKVINIFDTKYIILWDASITKGRLFLSQFFPNRKYGDSKI